MAYVLLTMGLAIAAADPCAAQRSFFVTTLGADTLAFEQIDRSADSVVGDWVSTYGGIMYHHYVIHLAPDGSVSRYQLTLHRVSGVVNGSIDIQLTGDSVVIRNGSGEEQRASVGRVIPVFTNTIGPLDLVVARARSTHRDSSAVQTLPAFGPYRARSTPVVFIGGDSAWFGNPQTPLRVHLDNEGHIVALSARATTTRTETRRVPPYDLRSVIAHFPNIPDSVGIVGVPAISPRDTVHASIGGAAVTIDYGRPAVRGRKVFANGVLGDTIWRTGANAATQFVTTRDLVIRNDTLRAGAYSLWTRVSPGNRSYSLIFNSQTGQWGTEHHPERDMLAVPLERKSLGAPRERFTITLPSSAGRSELRLEWSTTELSVPVTAR